MSIYLPGSGPLVGTVLAFGTFAIGFPARPPGGAYFGEKGDTQGRKKVLPAGSGDGPCGARPADVAGEDRLTAAPARTVTVCHDRAGHGPDDLEGGPTNQSGRRSTVGA